MGWVNSIPFEEMKGNALMLAKTASILKMPTVLLPAWRSTRKVHG